MLSASDARPRLGSGLVFVARAREGLLEGLAALAVIAVLIAVALGEYRTAIAKAALVEAATVSVAYRTEVALALATSGRMPASVTTGDN